MALSKQQSLSLYGTESYTAWGEAEAKADYAAKNPSRTTTQQTTQPTQNLQTDLNSYQSSVYGGQTAPSMGTSSPQTAQDLVDMGFYGYTAWGDAEAIADFKATGGSGKGSATGGGNGTTSSNLLPVPTLDELKNQLTPGVGLPEPLDRVSTFEQYRADMGVAELEQNLTNLKAEQDALYAGLRSQISYEEGKPVATNVIAGRVTEAERAAQERIDFVGRQVARITDELNTKYGVINTYMNLMGLDYNDAVDRYNTEFSQNLQMYNMILDIQKENVSIQQHNQSIASANLQTMINAITSGNLSYNNLPADQKLLIRKLELQTGLPAGFTENLKMSKSDSMLFQTSNEGITQIGFLQEDGSVRVEEYGRQISDGGGGGKLTTADYMSYLREDIQNYANLDQVMNFYSEFLDDTEILRQYDRLSPFGQHTESNKELYNKYGIEL